MTLGEGEPMSPQDRWMSPEGYAATGGAVCPACGSTDLSRGPLRKEEAIAVTQTCACLTCQSTWFSVFELMGYEACQGEESLC
jgi:hypothetical protein